jgi:hypothetical protein
MHVQGPDMPVQGPELPSGLNDDKHHDALSADLPLQWLAHQVSEKRAAELAELADKSGAPAPAPLHANVMAHHAQHVQHVQHVQHMQLQSQHHLAHMDMHIPMDSLADDHKRKLMQLEAMHKRARHEE